MIIALVTLCTFLSTFFAMLHFICSFGYRKEPERVPKKMLGFSLIIPCYNEEPIIKNTLDGVLRLQYRNYEAIFINDGSMDNSMPVFFDLLTLVPFPCDGAERYPGFKGMYRSATHPNIYVINKQNSGKADSLNVGIALSSKEIIVTLDGDSVLEKDALYVMNRVFQDSEVIASGGAVHVMQYFFMDKRKPPLIALQAVDYIKGFYVYKPSLCINNALNIISGAFGVFRKDALKEVGGFRNGLGEDIDITIRLQEYAQKHKKIITYTMDAICYTECPQTWKDLQRQRVRWQKAFWDAVVHNKQYLF
ncbi:MAG: glycosyltransferase family 2 protein, partial [Eubacteriales bacterium]|nr:glycosyltransferase family 2 protein [Eubacteriales bacterium]